MTWFGKEARSNDLRAVEQQEPLDIMAIDIAAKAVGYHGNDLKDEELSVAKNALKRLIDLKKDSPLIGEVEELLTPEIDRCFKGGTDLLLSGPLHALADAGYY